MQNCSYIFFSLFKDPVPVFVFSFLFILLVEVFLFNNFAKVWERLLVILIGVGGTWNLIDAINDGCVYDPFNFFGLYHFNIPDLLISVSSLTLFVVYFIKIKTADFKSVQNTKDE